MTAARHMEDLASMWPLDEGEPFSDRVMEVASTYYSSALPIEAAARLLGCTVAELQGLLRLSAIDPDKLQLLDATPPPATTWFLFAGARSDEEFKQGLSALSTTTGEISAFDAVSTAMLESSEPDAFSRVTLISAECFWHLAHKAKQYEVLSKSARRFLGQLAKQKGAAERAGRPLELSRKQLDWLVGILWELVQLGVVSGSSLDDDQAHCDTVLQALGVAE